MREPSYMKDLLVGLLLGFWILATLFLLGFWIQYKNTPAKVVLVSERLEQCVEEGGEYWLSRKANGEYYDKCEKILDLE
jgi:hypothetical protein